MTGATWFVEAFTGNNIRAWTRQLGLVAGIWNRLYLVLGWSASFRHPRYVLKDIC